MADLQDKAINIQGKKYVLVSDRVLAFNEKYLTGYIKSELLSDPEAEVVIMKATVTPNSERPERSFTGHSQAKWGDGFINKASALENAETSAVGRALAMMGIGVIDSIASVDEIKKAEEQSKGGEQTQQTQQTQQQEVNGSQPYCTIHDKPMKERTTRTGGTYFDHRWQDGEGNWIKCNGKAPAKDPVNF